MQLLTYYGDVAVTGMMSLDIGLHVHDLSNSVFLVVACVVLELSGTMSVFEAKKTHDPSSYLGASAEVEITGSLGFLIRGMLS